MENENQNIETTATQPKPTISQRLSNLAEEPDFGVPDIQTIDYTMKNYNMNITPERANNIVKTSGIRASVGEQTAVALENVLSSIGTIPDAAMLAYGNTVNYLTQGNLGEEIQNMAFDSLQKKFRDMGYAEDAIGGIQSELAKLVGEAASFAELALVGLATGGSGALAQIAAQEMGEGVYNDMQKYADEHDGSIEGYAPESSDFALNVANVVLQTAIERLGVGSPRFLHGASRGLWKEGASGFVQEGVQGFIHDLNEVLKGNIELQDMAENADQYLRDAIVGGLLQGGMGAATYGTARRRADNIVAQMRAKAYGRETPNAEDKKLAKAYNDQVETGYASAMTTEWKKLFDAQTGEGQLYEKILGTLKKATDKYEDWADLDETEKAQRLEQIAQQETLRAAQDSIEKGQSISEHELNNITYKDGAIWLEGVTPELGETTKPYARVLAERQSGLNEVLSEIDTLKKEIAQTKKELAEAKKANKEALAEKLQAQIEKQNARAEKRRLDAQKLEQQTAKIQEQIEKSQKQQPVARKVEPTKVVEPAPQRIEKQLKKVKEPVAKKSLKEERKAQKESGQLFLFQGSIKGAGDTARGSYDEKLKRIILGEKSDVSTIQHEMAHYWIQNNFKWARSGLASQEWLDKWNKVEDWLGIERKDRFLSREASEKFAKSFERYVLEGRVDANLQWAYDGFRKFYEETYEDLESQYFDLNEELSQDVVDWFNSVAGIKPMERMQNAVNKIGQAIMAQGGSVVEKAGDNAITVSSANENGEVQTTVYVDTGKTQDSEYLKTSGKEKTSGVSETLRRIFGDQVDVNRYEAMDMAGTVDSASVQVKADKELAIKKMLDDNVDPMDRVALFNALTRDAVENNDSSALRDLSSKQMSELGTKIGQIVALYKIESETGFNPVKIAQTVRAAKGELSQEQFNKALEEMNLDNVELSEEDVSALENETECLL